MLRRANAPMDLSTIVLVEHDARAGVAKDDRIKTHVKSTAILRALTALGLPLSTLGWAGLALVPRIGSETARTDVVARVSARRLREEGRGGIVRAARRRREATDGTEDPEGAAGGVTGAGRTVDSS